MSTAQLVKGGGARVAGYDSSMHNTDDLSCAHGLRCKKTEETVANTETGHLGTEAQIEEIVERSFNSLTLGCDIPASCPSEEGKILVGAS